MDEARIWSVARTPTQIQSTMNAEITSGAGLTGRWGFNEGTGNDGRGFGRTGSTARLVNGAHVDGRPDHR